MTVRPCRTGIVSRRIGTSRCQRGCSSRQIRPSTTARRSCGFSAAPTRARHRVLRVRGGRRGRAATWATQRNSSAHTPPVAPPSQRDPDQEVGERHVGQQLPLGHHALQVLDRLGGQLGVLGEQVAHGGHAAPLPVRAPAHPITWEDGGIPRAPQKEEPCPSAPASVATARRTRPATASAPTPEPRPRRRRTASEPRVVHRRACRAFVPLRSMRVLRTSTVVVVVPAGPDSTVTVACSSTAIADLLAQPVLQPGRGVLPAALGGQQLLQLLVQAVLGQAGPALVEVLGQHGAPARRRTRGRGTARPRRAPRRSRCRGGRRSS